MRTVAQIQQDISKLQAELADVKVYEHKRNAAVSILENLGWTHSATGGWKKPKELTKDEVKARPFSDKSPIRAGDLATWDDKVLGGNVLVRELVPGTTKALVSWISNVTFRGFTAGMTTFTVDVKDLTVRHRHWFIGK